MRTRLSAPETDCEFLLRILSDGHPHTLNNILQQSFAERGHGLTVHSRAANLREHGHTIATWRTGQRGDGSWYQLLSEPAGSEPSFPPGDPAGSLNSDTEQLTLA